MGFARLAGVLLALLSTPALALYAFPRITSGTPALSFFYDTGNQSANITVTAAAGLVNGPVQNLVNGASTQTTTYFGSVSLSGGAYWVQFKWATPKVVTEVTWTQSSASAQGTWQWQGSNDGATWTNIGSSVAFSAASQVFTTLSGNATAYSYYRILGVSGTGNSGPWQQQVQFKTGH